MTRNFGDKKPPVYPGKVPREYARWSGAGTAGAQAPAVSPGSHPLPVMDQKDAPLVHSGEVFIKLGKSLRVAKLLVSGLNTRPASESRAIHREIWVVRH